MSDTIDALDKLKEHGLIPLGTHVVGRLEIVFYIEEAGGKAFARKNQHPELRHLVSLATQDGEPVAVRLTPLANDLDGAGIAATVREIVSGFPSQALH